MPEPMTTAQLEAIRARVGYAHITPTSMREAYRVDVPALLAEVDRLRAENARLRAENERLNDWIAEVTAQTEIIPPE